MKTGSSFTIFDVGHSPEEAKRLAYVAMKETALTKQQTLTKKGYREISLVDITSFASSKQ